MADVTTLVWFLVGVIVIEGVWLAGLTYLMWRRHREKAQGPAGTATPAVVPPPPAEPPKSP